MKKQPSKDSARPRIIPTEHGRDEVCNFKLDKDDLNNLSAAVHLLKATIKVFNDLRRGLEKRSKGQWGPEWSGKLGYTKSRKGGAR